MKPKLNAVKFQVQAHQTTSGGVELLLVSYHLNPALFPNAKLFCAKDLGLALSPLMRKRLRTMQHGWQA